MSGLPVKYEHELAYWKEKFALAKGSFYNKHFEQIMLGMAKEPDDTFLTGKVIADFGCGPRGSLAWVKTAAIKIGIDVLSDVYADNFKSAIISHNMIYVKNSEKVIPLPTNSIDVMFTQNAIDHVDNFPAMCSEILRVLKPGGEFIGSFNLNEPASETEPQMLTEELIARHLLNYLTKVHYQIARRYPDDNRVYDYMLAGQFDYTKGDNAFLWVRYRKADF